MITCILYDQPTNASGFKMSNKSYMRFVLIIHIEGIADGRTFQHSTSFHPSCPVPIMLVSTALFALPLPRVGF